MEQPKPLLPMPIRAAPYKHQITAFNFVCGKFGLIPASGMAFPGAALLMEMGTGKTITSIAVAGALYQARRIRRVLVVAPLSILGVWDEEFAKFADFDYSLAVLEGSGAKKTDTLRHMRGTPLQVAVINYESAWRLEKELAAWNPDLIIADEGHKIKTHNIAASKAMHRLGARARYRLLLTGTVITNKAIEPEVFDLVQSEIKKRKARGPHQSGIGCFSGRIICGDCGGLYGSKVWHSNSKYRRTVWQCNNKFKNGTYCKTPHLSEETLQKAFVEAFNRIVENKDWLIEDYDAIIAMLTDTAELDKESKRLRDECAVVMELIRKCVDENAHSAMDQGEYQERYNGLVTRYEAAKKRLDTIADEKQARVAKRENITRFLDDLRRRDGIIEGFDEELWYATVETVTVSFSRELTFVFKNGAEMKAQM